MAVDDTYTKSLLHFEGADGSPTFTDESGKAWTRSGDAQIDTAQYVFGGASGLFDGTGDYISASDSVDWYLDDGSNSNYWTIDFRVRFNSDPGTGEVPFYEQYVDASNWIRFNLYNNLLFFAQNIGGAVDLQVQKTWNPAGDTWYHVALVKNGTTGYLMFVDGTQVGTTETKTINLSNFAGGVDIGRQRGGSLQYFNGWFDEYRISKGVARWTANFTPPTQRYGGGGQVIWWS